MRKIKIYQHCRNTAIPALLLFLFFSCSTPNAGSAETLPTGDLDTSTGTEQNGSRSNMDWSDFDKSIDNTIREQYDSIPALVAALDSLTETDWERTRATWMWITHNIAYDTDSYFKGLSGPTDAIAVFDYGASVCEGYAGIFEAIGGGLGLEVVKVHGYGKGYGYNDGAADPGGSNHAWTAVQIEGNWHLFDTTWGAGYVDGSSFSFHYNEFFFDTPPEELIFSHYPEESEFQLISDTVSRKMFFELPNLRGTAFNAGVDATICLEIARDGERIGLPQLYTSDIPARFEVFPMTGSLSAGRDYDFVIVTDAPFALLSYGSDGSDIIENRNGKISFEGSWPAGRLGIYLAPLNAKSPYDTSYQAFAEYPVD